jgi:hypothetical protein
MDLHIEFPRSCRLHFGSVPPAASFQPRRRRRVRGDVPRSRRDPRQTRSLGCSRPPGRAPRPSLHRREDRCRAADLPHRHLTASVGRDSACAPKPRVVWWEGVRCCAWIPAFAASHAVASGILRASGARAARQGAGQTGLACSYERSRCWSRFHVGGHPAPACRVGSGLVLQPAQPGDTMPPGPASNDTSFTTKERPAGCRACETYPRVNPWLRSTFATCSV